VIKMARILRRSAVQVDESQIIPALRPQTLELARPSLIDVLQKQKAEAGSEWPENLRIEPVVKKEMLKDVHKDIRPRLKKLLQER
jgi:hypothetical protein